MNTRYIPDTNIMYLHLQTRAAGGKGAFGAVKDGTGGPIGDPLWREVSHDEEEQSKCEGFGGTQRDGSGYSRSGPYIDGTTSVRNDSSGA